MRLLLTTDTVGGVWSYSATLAAALVERHGIEVLLAAFGPAPSMAQEAQIAAIGGVELRSYPSLLEWQPGSDADLPGARQWLRELAHDWRASLLHTNQYAFGDLATACPRIVVAHSDLLSWHEWCQPLDGPLPIDANWLDFIGWYGELLRRQLAGADVVVAPSEFIAAGIRRHYDYSKPIRVIHNGVVTALGEQPASRDDAGSLRVFSAGRFWDRGKNIALLLDAVGAGIPGVIIEVAGAGLQAAAGAAHWLGELPHQELLARLPSYHAYVGTSRYEPFGLAPLEAALAGCALVLNDIPTFRELWQGAALFVQRDSCDGLRAMLQQLAADPVLLDGYRQAARKRAKDYSADRMADQYYALYQQLLGGHAAPKLEPTLFEQSRKDRS